MVTIKPNILFLVIDSLRADQCFGDSKTSKTPNIDLLIKNGVYFSQTISSSPSTYMASASIMTGFYPFKALRNDRTHQKLLSNVVTYIGLLRDFGYYTYAAIPKAVDLMGIANDFEDKYAADFKDLVLSTGFGQKVVEKLESKKMQEPWIFYIHITDLHELVCLPEQFNHDKFGTNQYERMAYSLDVWIGKILQTIALEKTIVILTADHGSEDGIHMPNTKSVNYNKHVLDFDQKIYPLISNTFWFKQDLSPKLFSVRKIIGKCLRVPKNILTQIRLAKIKLLKRSPSEKRIHINDLIGTEDLYDERIRIPLVFSGHKIPKGLIIKQQTRSIDIFPTIADLIGLPKRKDKIHGISLISYFKGNNMEELPARIESTPKWLKSISKNQLGTRTSEYKYLRDRDNPQKDVYLFDLKNDPFEEKNIAKQYPAIVQKMENILSELNTDSISMNELEDMSEETVEKIEKELKKLGYI